MRMAGASDCLSGSLPYLPANSTSAAGRPGIPADHGPLIDLDGSRLPALSRNLSGEADSGAVSRASIITSLPVLAWCNKKNPPPPRPELIGSTTPRVEDTATAASKALPPWAMISRPASVASLCPEAMAVPGGCAAGAAVEACCALAATASKTVRATAISLESFTHAPR